MVVRRNATFLYVLCFMGQSISYIRTVYRRSSVDRVLLLRWEHKANLSVTYDRLSRTDANTALNSSIFVWYLPMGSTYLSICCSIKLECHNIQILKLSGIRTIRTSQSDNYHDIVEKLAILKKLTILYNLKKNDIGKNLVNGVNLLQNYNVSR